MGRNILFYFEEHFILWKFALYIYLVVMWPRQRERVPIVKSSLKWWDHLPVDYLPLLWFQPQPKVGALSYGPVYERSELCKQHWCDHTMENMNSCWATFPFLDKPPSHHTIQSQLCKSIVRNRKYTMFPWHDQFDLSIFKMAPCLYYM